MNLVETILNAGGGAAARTVGSQLGLGQHETMTALSALVPALAAGLQQHAQTPTGLGGLMNALASGRHQRYVDEPSTLRDPAAVDDGNAILGHILGSKDASRQVATAAAAHTGIGADILKKMLPMAATLVMGALAQHAARPPADGQPAQAPAGGGFDLGALLGSATGGQPPNDGAGAASILGRMFGR
jgi:hypothetical protein